MTTWFPVPDHSDFSIHNLPYGIFSTPALTSRVGVAIGDKVVDMQAAAALGLFHDVLTEKWVFAKPVLNDFINLGRPVWQAVRARLQELLTNPSSPLRLHASQVLLDQSAVRMEMPLHIGDYTDFYSSIDHATNVGKMFRDPANALLPNWRHLPVGYHGRASSIVLSGQPLHRPLGQMLPKGAETPVFGPSQRLDFELETAFVIGQNTTLGQSIPVEKAEEHIFGMVLFNDWSARDIQQWEYVPLGPFLGKNFGSSISPWIVTMEALEPFRVAGYQQEPEPLPYLRYTGLGNYDIQLEVSLQPDNSIETVISRSNTRFLYWNMAQQLAHHTVNGCNMRVGDLLASGTISGPEPESFGSMLELAWSGSKPLTLNDGSTRTFIQDLDTVTMRGFAEKDGVRVGFGEVRTQILGVIEQ